MTVVAPFSRHVVRFAYLGSDPKPRCRKSMTCIQQRSVFLQDGEIICRMGSSPARFTIYLNTLIHYMFLGTNTISRFRDSVDSSNRAGMGVEGKRLARFENRFNAGSEAKYWEYSLGGGWAWKGVRRQTSNSSSLTDGLHETHFRWN